MKSIPHLAIGTLGTFMIATAPIHSTALAGDCLRDLRKVKLGKLGVKRVRDYFCKSSNGSRPTVRLKYYRMSDLALSSIVDGLPVKGISSLFGRNQLANSPALAEFKVLLKKFATRENRDGYYSLQAFVPSLGKTISVIDEKLAPKALATRTLGGWQQSSTYDFPALDLARRTGTNTVTRPMTRNDLKNYRSSIKGYKKIVQVGTFDWQRAFTDRYVELLKYVSRDGMPSDFIILRRKYQDCGDFANVSFVPRRLTADIVVLENVSSRTITIDSISGQLISQSKLRRVQSFESLNRRRQRKITSSSFRLKPGQKRAFVTRLIFLRGDDNALFGEARKAHQRLPAYTYGPEAHFSALVINGENFKLSGNSANFLQLTMGDESGSCPFLVSWDPKVQDWVSHGKVLHEATGADREMSEVKTFDGFVGRFQLQEREAELAKIDRAFLDIETRDGNMVRLLTDHPQLRSRDSQRLHLHWGELAEFKFELPDWIKPSDVVRSKLNLRGYYERYSDIMAYRHGQACLRKKASVRANNAG